MAGKTIRELRDERGLTQFSLAARVRVRPESVSRWERGVSQPTNKNLEDLARVFEVPVEAIRLVEAAEGKVAA